ncbi:MAG: exodeoxyribonuclease VII small subunit [Clostridia bacterium]|nr:exodeoxyribonuclease VII small subunit [Clostridia bacterium]
MEKKLTYEEAVAKLEQIVEQLEQGEISLEKSVELFTEGMNLIKTCNLYLNEAESKIKVLVNGEYQDLQAIQED